MKKSYQKPEILTIGMASDDIMNLSLNENGAGRDDGLSFGIEDFE